MPRRKLTLVLGLVLAVSACSTREEPAEEPGLEVALTPQLPDRDSDRWLRWSPKGEQLPLTADEGALVTSISLGPEGPPFGLRLARSETSDYYDQLFIDGNRNGQFEEGELLETTPSESRNKFWSSFSSSIDLSVADPWSGEAAVNPYPLNLWYVEDPREDEQEMILRYSRDGWMEGRVTLDGVDAVILLTESLMDGVYDGDDYWALASADSAGDVLKLEYARPLTKHAWLHEKAYEVKGMDPSGRKVVLIPVDPGMTRAEEEEIDDYLAVDREAPRSGRMVAFLHDFGGAQAQARREGKPLFIDFETTWCGPCKLMDQWVYTADPVVDASASYVAVKVDGDDFPELKERFQVEGFPTTILLSPEGEELRRVSGYVNVEAMTEFLTGGEE